MANVLPRFTYIHGREPSAVNDPSNTDDRGQSGLRILEKIVVASADTQKDGTEVSVVEIRINGVTRTAYSTERDLNKLIRALADLDEARRVYL